MANSEEVRKLISPEKLETAFDDYLADPTIAELIDLSIGDRDLVVKGMKTAFMAGVITAFTAMVIDLQVRIDRRATAANTTNTKVN